MKNETKRVYWKEAVKEEKQQAFLKMVAERMGGLKDGAKEITLALKNKSGKELELYIPEKDFNVG